MDAPFYSARHRCYSGRYLLPDTSHFCYHECQGFPTERSTITEFAALPLPEALRSLSPHREARGLAYAQLTIQHDGIILETSHPYTHRAYP